MFGMIGETVSFEIRPSLAAEEIPVVDGLRVEVFEEMTVTTSIPSFKGAPTGAIEDPLFPVARLRSGVNYWVDVTPLKQGSFALSLGGKTTQVRGLSRLMPRVPSHPIYAELQFAQIARAHGMADEGSTLAARCLLVAQYRELLRMHRVEPIKSYVSQYPPVANGKLDLDGTFAAYGKACTLRGQVFDGAIAPPMLWGMNVTQPPSSALLAAVKASRDAGEIPALSMAYVWDEGELDPALSATALDRAKAAKPYLDTFITRRPSDTFRPFITSFCPVQNWLTSSMNPECSYASCMANGNCANHTSADQVAPATGYPMQVLDAPDVQARAFPLVSYSAGAKMSLYFNTTQNLPSAWAVGGLYSEGGNGDGTLLYPGVTGQKGLTADIPVSSKRLKRWRQASYDIEYDLIRKEAGIPACYTITGTSYPTSHATYDACREKIARATLGL